jgi:hypothetical protein
VWNVLSSRQLFRAAESADCVFCRTSYVLYECLHKHRKSESPSEIELRTRLRSLGANDFMSCDLDIADLQTVGILEQRKNLGKGELSSIAFAMRTSLAFLSDDQKARKLALGVVAQQRVQTTTHLFGWMFFYNQLADGDKTVIVSDHIAMNRPLETFFEQMYLEVLRCRLMANQQLSDDGS